VIKAFNTLIALMMFVISVGSWRYQGDIHHMHKKIFENQKQYSQNDYQNIWKKYSKDKNNTKREMSVIHLYDIPMRLLGKSKPSTSELILDNIIESKSWSRFIPNSKSSTYPLSQKIWMSQNLTIDEAIEYLLENSSKPTSPLP